MSLEIRELETVYEGYSTIRVATLAGPDEATFKREIEDHGEAASVLPYDPERRVALLVKLPRAPVIWTGGPERLTEAPAGMIDEGEAAEATVRREALEEAGVKLDELEPLGALFPSPGVSAERIHLFLAPYSAETRSGDGGGVEGEHENIEVVEVPLAELWRRAEAGELLDMKTLTLILALKLRRPDLF
jgi:nudix-type nucleoside diphosphatase (YffH/AdpP family)